MCECEFPFIEASAWDFQDDELLDYLEARWPRLSANVSKLRYAAPAGRCDRR
jgi:hypothetical protein